MLDRVPQGSQTDPTAADNNMGFCDYCLEPLGCKDFYRALIAYPAAGLESANLSY